MVRRKEISWTLRRGSSVLIVFIIVVIADEVPERILASSDHNDQDLDFSPDPRHERREFAGPGVQDAALSSSKTQR